MKKNFGAKAILYPMPVLIIGTYGDTKKQRRIDTDNRIKAAAVEVFAEYGYERAQLSYMSKLFGRIGERA